MSTSSRLSYIDFQENADTFAAFKEAQWEQVDRLFGIQSSEIEQERQAKRRVLTRQLLTVNQEELRTATEYQATLQAAQTTLLDPTINILPVLEVVRQLTSKYIEAEIIRQGKLNKIYSDVAEVEQNSTERYLLQLDIVDKERTRIRNYRFPNRRPPTAQ